MKFLHEAALGGAGAGVITGLYTKGYLGDGLFSIQLAVTLSLLCFSPVLYRASSKLSVSLNLFLTALASIFILPVFAKFMSFLFTGHRRPESTVFDALWRVPAILALWIGFAKLNEEILKPAFKKIPMFNTPGGIGALANARHRGLVSKKAKGKEAIAVRMRSVIARERKAKKLIEEKEEELKKAMKQAKKAHSLFEKKQAALKDDGDNEEMEEECEVVKEMAQNAKTYVDTLKSQIENAKNDLRECECAKDKLEKEWKNVDDMTNATTFYR